MATKVTVTPADEKEQDIFKPGNLVQHTSDGEIVLVTTVVPFDEHSFSGVSLSGEHIGDGVGDGYLKSDFKSFGGTITLQST